MSRGLATEAANRQIRHTPQGRHRPGGFERDPGEIISAPAVPREEGQRTLVLTAARALGVATVGDLADYFRLPAVDARARARELAGLEPRAAWDAL